jgi:hypothetical protein
MPGAQHFFADAGLVEQDPDPAGLVAGPDVVHSLEQ